MKKAMILSLLAPLCIALAPAASAANFNEAVKLYRAKNYSAALQELKACDEKFPNNTLVRYYMGLSHQQLGHVGPAKSMYKWVADNGDVKYRERAQKGYDQLSGLRSQRSSSPASSSAGGKQQNVAKAKVKKVIEFYADW